MDEDTPEHWKDEINSLQCALESANENGLLKDDAAAYQKIMGYITGALTDLNSNPPKVVEGREKFSWVAKNSTNTPTPKAHGGVSPIVMADPRSFTCLAYWFRCYPFGSCFNLPCLT